jgi:hypothetical protein
MSWAVVRPAAFLKALVPKFVPWARRPSHAPQSAEASTPKPIAATVSDRAPLDVRELRLRPEVEKPLLDAGMPPEGSSLYDGPKRAADTPENAACKFVMWAQAVGAVGAHTVRTVSALYWECAEVDHREPVAIDRFLRALRNARGIRRDTSPADRRRSVWIIDSPERPLIPKAQVAVAQKVTAQTPHLHPRVLQRLTPERDYSSPEVLRAMAHDARRQGRARKQRGSRDARWTS